MILSVFQLSLTPLNNMGWMKAIAGPRHHLLDQLYTVDLPHLALPISCQRKKREMIEEKKGKGEERRKGREGERDEKESSKFSI